MTSPDVRQLTTLYRAQAFHVTISAQCPSCELHELVPVTLRRQPNGLWKQDPDALDADVAAAGDPDEPKGEAVIIDVCPVCYGAWFDAGELDVLAGEHAEVEKVLDQEARPADRPCPHGHGMMLEHSLPGRISTPLDRCAECGGLWLDGEERRKLAKSTTKEGQQTTRERLLTRGAIWAAQLLAPLPVEVENPARGTPWIVFTLLVVFLGAYLLELLGVIDAYFYGIVAGRFVREYTVYTLLTHQFLHGSWFHLLGNAYFLYTFGDNVEHLFGRKRFVLFFVGAGIAGGLLHVLLTRATALPVVGASGAIAGVLAAYMWAFPRARLLQTVLYIQLKLPVWVFLIGWVGLHLAYGFFTNNKDTAWFAHLGGFLFGLAITPLILRMRRREVASRVRVPAKPRS